MNGNKIYTKEEIVERFEEEFGIEPKLTEYHDYIKARDVIKVETNSIKLKTEFELIVPNEADWIVSEQYLEGLFKDIRNGKDPVVLK